MNLDQYGLPVQADGDPNDQLNRVSILALSDRVWYKQISLLYSYPGNYLRHVGGNPNNVSGDQLVPIFAAQMLWHEKAMHGPARFRALCKALIRRLGFAQNTHDTTPGKRKLMPDFLLHRVIMFISRVYFNTLLINILDIFLFLNTLVTIIDLRVTNDPDHVDPFVNAVATLYACNVYHPTYLSKLSARMLEAGASKVGTLGDGVYAKEHIAGMYFSQWTSHVVGGLRWYHRAASGGNPEIGEVQVGHWVKVLKIARS